MAVTAAVAAIAASTYAQYDQGRKASNAQRDAAAQAERNATAQAAQADQAYNRANQKKPSVSGILGANEGAAKAGLSSTMLTGPTGIDTASLLLGKQTLLGG